MSKEERYLMCEDQPAQIDCRRETCIYHQNASCTNSSPAITLNSDGSSACWSSVEEPMYYICDNSRSFDFVSWILPSDVLGASTFDLKSAQRFTAKQVKEYIDVANVPLTAWACDYMYNIASKYVNTFVPSFYVLHGENLSKK